MRFLLSHVHDDKTTDLPVAVEDVAISTLIERLLREGLVESVNISTTTGDDIIFVKG